MENIETRMSSLIKFMIFFVLSIGSYGQNYLLPNPQQMEVMDGFYPLKQEIGIRMDQNIPELDFLKKQLEEITDKKVVMLSEQADISISIEHKDKNNPEGYELYIDKNGIRIKSPSNRGAFYGIQTLLQLIREHKEGLTLPFLVIKDFPKFKYRGMMLDVGRHFFEIGEVKKFIDYLASYKYNKFHWHLTEDQGWRIAIEKYPKLTEIGSWRKETQVGRYFDYNLYDGKKHGGYYTQEEIKEVVRYAQERHIDVIPEIEMPGHAQAAIAAYPELGCTGKPIEVWTRWGVSQNIYCPREITFEFLENVIDEVIELFPYEYIHIGGDEAAKEQWRDSRFVQDLIKHLGLKDEEELQSYFITRMEKYINAKGKKIIGWDEILQGGIAPNATVMSWRGEKGGIEAANSGHQAIMTPASTNYFDYYQGSPASEPLAWGGDLRLKKVYAYDPIPHGLSKENRNYIIGTQANVWAEYISDFNQVEYMIFPRLFALSEVAWGTSDPAEYDNFEQRVIKEFDFLEEQGINYSRAIFEVEGSTVVKDEKLFYKLKSANESEQIRYTLDGTEPNHASPLYKNPVLIDRNLTLKAANFEEKERVSEVFVQKFGLSKSTAKNIKLKYPPSTAYERGSADALVNGIRGDIHNHRVHWLGFKKDDVVATLDFGGKEHFNKIAFSTLNLPDWEIYYPQKIEVYISDSGEDFRKIHSLSLDEIKLAEGQVQIEVGRQKSRYLQLKLKNLGVIPKGLSGAGSDAYLFIDEIVVN